MANFSLTPLAAARNGTGKRSRGVTSAVTLTLHSVIPGRRGSGEPGIPSTARIPGSPFGRPGMTLSESDVGDITLTGDGDTDPKPAKNHPLGTMLISCAPHKK